jgi:hypothetical protein
MEETLTTHTSDLIHYLARLETSGSNVSEDFSDGPIGDSISLKLTLPPLPNGNPATEIIKPEFDFTFLSFAEDSEA